MFIYPKHHPKRMVNSEEFKSGHLLPFNKAAPYELLRRGRPAAPTKEYTETAIVPLEGNREALFKDLEKQRWSQRMVNYPGTNVSFGSAVQDHGERNITLGDLCGDPNIGVDLSYLTSLYEPTRQPTTSLSRGLRGLVLLPTSTYEQRHTNGLMQDLINPQRKEWRYVDHHVGDLMSRGVSFSDMREGMRGCALVQKMKIMARTLADYTQSVKLKVSNPMRDYVVVGVRLDCTYRAPETIAPVRG